MMMRLLLLLLVQVTVSEGKNVTGQLEVTQHWGDGWEGKFCFDLPTPIFGYEVLVHFNSPVKDLKVRTLTDSRRCRCRSRCEEPELPKYHFKP